MNLSDMKDFDKLPDGFYIVRQPGSPDWSLVRLYFNRDANARGVGFGIWDGSGFVPLADLRDTVLTPVRLVEQEVPVADGSFEQAVTPAIDWLRWYGNPHARIIVEQAGAELAVGEKSFPVPFAGAVNIRAIT